MKHLAFFLLSIFTMTLSADCEFERTVESISYNAQTGNTVGQIKLSDGSTWKWTPDAYSENLLRKWTEGDQIIIRMGNHPGFILQNLQRPHYMPVVSLNFDSYLIFPCIESLGDMGKSIALSDGSEWELVYDFDLRSLTQWAIGDRVIPMKGFQETFELINLDIPFENHRFVERNIQVAQSKCPLPAPPALDEEVEQLPIELEVVQNP